MSVAVRALEVLLEAVLADIEVTGAAAHRIQAVGVVHSLAHITPPQLLVPRLGEGVPFWAQSSHRGGRTERSAIHKIMKSAFIGRKARLLVRMEHSFQEVL